MTDEALILEKFSNYLYGWSVKKRAARVKRYLILVVLPRCYRII